MTSGGVKLTSVQISLRSISVKFQITVSFPCKQQMPTVEKSCAELLKLLTSAHVSCYYCLKNNQERNISFALIKFALIKRYYSKRIEISNRFEFTSDLM